ncbi:OLC1v1020580C1 [Oldenlandia corymbosa var. corymbosa]|uniref:OLC1v1020580C1 n=1 Tax=Oldenlandia corymbosa var. corymbosa TaxID=529605 RepID=A0AAV1EGX3_OLDCO|nr:OLC1v1020580C1 [Oldenlandia corymbosa var. corymbosa]
MTFLLVLLLALVVDDGVPGSVSASAEAPPPPAPSPTCRNTCLEFLVCRNYCSSVFQSDVQCEKRCYQNLGNYNATECDSCGYSKSDCQESCSRMCDNLCDEVPDLECNLSMCPVITKPVCSSICSTGRGSGNV